MTSYNPFGLADAFTASEWERPAACGSDGGNCVEVNRSVAGYVAVRDSKQAGSPVLVFSDHEWRRFLIAVRSGQYDN